MIGFYSIGQLSAGEALSDIDASEASAYSKLLKNPDANFTYLIEAFPYNPEKNEIISDPLPINAAAINEYELEVKGGVEIYYLSDRGYFTDGDDTPAHTSYLPVTDNPFQFDVSILSGDDFRGTSPSYGAVRIFNGDGEFDEFVNYYLGGREISVYAGAEYFTRKEFAKIFSGFLTQPEFSEDEIILNIGDKSNLLDSEFVQNLYKGSGGLEGGGDIANTPKPLVYGECLNIKPVTVDSGQLIYQLHDGSIESIDAVYDKGIALENGGDTEDILTADPDPGSYITQLSGGYIRLGSSPVGRVTCDVKGDNANGYVNKIGSITRRLLQTKLGVKSLTDSELDTGSFLNFDMMITGKAGIYLDNEIRLTDALNDLIIPVQGYWIFTREGKFKMGVLDAPGEANFTITDNDIEQDSFEIRRVIPPAWRLTLGYKKAWLQQTEDDLATGALSEYKTFVSEEYRKVTLEDGQVKGRTASLKERSFNSLLIDREDAIFEIERFRRMYGAQRKVYKLNAASLLFRVYVGDVIKIKSEKFGLNQGLNCLVTSISEDVETGVTELELWG